jgi:hypothetical protein
VSVAYSFCAAAEGSRVLCVERISVPIVKQAIRIVSEKSGLPRSDFAAIL